MTDTRLAHIAQFAFVAAGAGFLSDELLAFDPDAGRARAFPRAIKIRDECVDYFPELGTATIKDTVNEALRIGDR